MNKSEVTIIDIIQILDESESILVILENFSEVYKKNFRLFLDQIMFLYTNNMLNQEQICKTICLVFLLEEKYNIDSYYFYLLQIVLQRDNQVEIFFTAWLLKQQNIDFENVLKQLDVSQIKSMEQNHTEIIKNQLQKQILSEPSLELNNFITEHYFNDNIILENILNVKDFQDNFDKYKQAIKFGYFNPDYLVPEPTVIDINNQEFISTFPYFIQGPIFNSKINKKKSFLHILENFDQINEKQQQLIYEIIILDSGSIPENYLIQNMNELIIKNPIVMSRMCTLIAQKNGNLASSVFKFLIEEMDINSKSLEFLYILLMFCDIGSLFFEAFFKRRFQICYRKIQNNEFQNLKLICTFMNCLISEKKFKIENKQIWIEILNKFKEDNFIKELKISINNTKI